jgi:hypothetical protein
MTDVDSSLPAPELHGPVKLFKPSEATTVVAIFAHGVEDTAGIDPISGVTLGYYCPHGDTVEANITWAEGSPSHPPQAAPSSTQWASYVLTTVPLGSNADIELASSAETYKMAIAYVVDSTTSSDVIPLLASLGYSDIRGVHCREAVYKEESATFSDTREISRQTMVSEGWKDSSTDAITADTELEVGDAICDPSGSWYKILAVQDQTFTVARAG